MNCITQEDFKKMYFNVDLPLEDKLFYDSDLTEFKMNWNKMNNFYKHKNVYPFCDYVFKTNLIVSRKPKRFLEIGTWYGHTCASVKHFLPDCEVVTVCAPSQKGTNNSLKYDKVGIVFRREGIDVKQVWARTEELDYSTLGGNFDVIYIDACHKYENVKQDLENCEKIFNDMLILDDYVLPGRNSRWCRPQMKHNEGVVQATDEFMRKGHRKEKYISWHIYDTPVAIIEKRK